MPPSSTRARLVEAAFELFAEQGYAQTSIDDIAARAGTARTTFFRNFSSKDNVVFPDHDVLLPRVDARLATATTSTRNAALREGARIVLEHYISEGPIAHARYALTRTVEALHDREVASVDRYWRIFSRHARSWLADEPDGALRGELIASSVITAHNHVLRSWLRGGTDDPRREFDQAMDIALSPTNGGVSKARTILIHNADADLDQVLREVREALGGRPD